MWVKLTCGLITVYPEPVFDSGTLGELCGKGTDGPALEGPLKGCKVYKGVVAL